MKLIVYFCILGYVFVIKRGKLSYYKDKKEEVLITREKIMRRTSGIIKIALVLLSSLMLLTSCSTKKNKWNRRVYHNLTSHYNVWWNGDQSIKEGERTLKENIQDDFTEILPVFDYGTKENALSLNAQMDRAIEKSSICIQRHSMRFNGKEYVNWIDDAYLLMAKANFFKQDFIPARRTFDYVANSYKYNDIVHTANLWLAKTYIETEQYHKAEALLQALIVAMSETDKMPKYVRQNLDLVYADFYIKQKNYDAAVKYLKSAMINVKDKDIKVRSMFILGQIYQYQNDYQRATEQYEAVIKKHPDYEMTFEAKMNLAVCHNTGDTSSIMKMFWKMLDDNKNADYKDRIYYAMSDVAIKENNEPLGIDYLKRSVATSRNNNRQKVKSALKVATMLFDNGDYMTSQAYYDTVVMTMDRTYPEYDSLLNLSVVLGDLVLNLTTYQLQDSLLRLANMDSISRNVIIAQVIEDYKAEQERIAKEKEIQEQLALLGGDEITDLSKTNTSTNSSWYFYNQTSLTRGITEFRTKWGNRVLEDFWFISDKQSMSMGEEEEGETQEESNPFAGMTEEEMAKLTPEEIAEIKKQHRIAQFNSGVDSTSMKPTFGPTDIQYYLDQLPFTEEQQKDAHEQILEALNNIGFIYYDNIEDFNSSIDAYTEMNERYPENEHELSSWYYLYKMHSLREEHEQAEHYKNLVLSKYPDSNQAKIIIDPDYFIKEREKGQEASNLYAKTFEAYKNGQYQRVRMNVERARELYTNDTALMPRFEFLDAISIGYLEVVDSMAYALYRLVSNYPTSSIKPHAMEVLLKANDMYNLGLPVESARSKENVKEEKTYPYEYKSNEEYYVMIVCNSKSVRVNPLKVRLNDFNKESFRMSQLEVKSVMLNKQETLITIETFENEDKANDYTIAMFITDYLFGGINQDQYKILLISKANYPTFFKNKNVDEYIEFWNKNHKNVKK